MNLIEKIKEYGVFGSVNLAARRIVLLLSNYLKALLISFSPKKITEYELKEILTVSLQNTLTTNGINNSPLKAAVNFFIPGRFFITFAQSEQVIKAIDRFIPGAIREKIENANEISNHDFCFLGLKFRYGNTINWHNFPDTPPSWPLRYYPFIPYKGTSIKKI